MTILGCDDGNPVGPLAAVAGRYELTSVNGSPIPWNAPPSTGLPGNIVAGDLLLQRDRTFRVGIRGNFGSFLEGRYHLGGAAEGGGRVVVLSYGSGGIVAESQIVAHGDSAVWTIPATMQFPGIRYAFHRAAAPRGAMTGRYALTRVNGEGEPFVVYEETEGSETFQVLIGFDTVQFLGDGLFYRRHRAERTARLDATGTIVAIAASEWIAYGSYERADARLILHSLGAGPTDTLVAKPGGDAFQHSWAIVDTPVEAEYTRVP